MTRPFSPYADLGRHIRRVVAWMGLVAQSVLVLGLVSVVALGYVRIAQNDGNHNALGVFEGALVLTILGTLVAIVRCIGSRRWVRSAVVLELVALVGLAVSYPPFHCNFLVSYEVFTARHLAGPDLGCCDWMPFAEACSSRGTRGDHGR